MFETLIFFEICSLKCDHNSIHFKSVGSEMEQWSSLFHDFLPTRRGSERTICLDQIVVSQILTMCLDDLIDVLLRHIIEIEGIGFACQHEHPCNDGVELHTGDEMQGSAAGNMVILPFGQYRILQQLNSSGRVVLFDLLSTQGQW